MFSKTLIATAFASIISAATPPGFAPVSTGELTITFGNTLATAGTNLPKLTTSNIPTVGTAMRLPGTYSIMMVDPDLPPNTDGTSRGAFLHWLQTDLVSSSQVTVVGGRPIFPMVAGPGNTAALAPYTPPAPPALAPETHRYILMVVNTTANQLALTALNTAAQKRLPFDAASVVQSAGLQVLAANWFTVTNGTASSPAGGKPVSASGTATGANPTGTGVGFQSVADVLKTPGAIVTMLGLCIGFFL